MLATLESAGRAEKNTFWSWLPETNRPADAPLVPFVPPGRFPEREFPCDSEGDWGWVPVPPGVAAAAPWMWQPLARVSVMAYSTMASHLGEERRPGSARADKTDILWENRVEDGGGKSGASDGAGPTRNCACD